MTKAVRSAASDFFAGAALILRGGGLTLSRGELVSLAVLPVAVAVLASGLFVWLAVRFGDALLWPRPDPATVSGFATVWAWVGVVGWWLARATLGIVGILLGIVVGRIVAAPLMDLFAQRAMQALGVRPPEGVTAFGDLPIAHSAPRSVLRAAARGGVLVAGLVLLFLLGLIPGLGIVTAPLGFLWTALWLYVDTTVYALQWVGDAGLDDVRALARARPAAAWGFGLANALLMAVPLAGFVVTPAAVAGACLLVRDTPGRS